MKKIAFLVVLSFYCTCLSGADESASLKRNYDEVLRQSAAVPYSSARYQAVVKHVKILDDHIKEIVCHAIASGEGIQSCQGMGGILHCEQWPTDVSTNSWNDLLKRKEKITILYTRIQGRDGRVLYILGNMIYYDVRLTRILPSIYAIVVGEGDPKMSTVLSRHTYLSGNWCMLHSELSDEGSTVVILDGPSGSGAFASISRYTYSDNTWKRKTIAFRESMYGVRKFKVNSEKKELSYLGLVYVRETEKDIVKYHTVDLRTGLVQITDKEVCRLDINGEENRTVSVKDAVLFVVTLENTSSAPVKFIERSREKDYLIRVQDEKGNDVPLTLYGKRFADNADQELRRIVRTLAPMETVKDELHINRIFDMSLNGKYYVTVTRKVITHEGKSFVDIVSRRICVTVTDSDSSRSQQDTQTEYAPSQSTP